VNTWKSKATSWPKPKIQDISFSLKPIGSLTTLHNFILVEQLDKSIAERSQYTEKVQTRVLQTQAAHGNQLPNKSAAGGGGLAPMHLQCTHANSLVRTPHFVKSSLSLSSGCLLISFTVCCHWSLLYSKRPSHTTFPNLASCQLVLLKTRFFLSIHTAHKVTPRNRVHKELNFLRLLGSHLLKKHCSMLRAFKVQPGLVQKGHC
jgi:hypothetical protein